jgi:ring-1,2-phenylacetyl-CoA epoxidase subunit PaaD
MVAAGIANDAGDPSRGRNESDRGTPRAGDAWQVLEAVPDPEIPVLSIVDLGIVRFVRWSDDERLHVGLTPT